MTKDDFASLKRGKAQAEHYLALEADNARLRDLVAKFQRGEPSDKFEKHGA